jgi:hypothetical protein
MQFGGFLAAVKTLGRLTRVAHSVHFLMILLLLSGGVSAATPAEDSLPRLSLNNDAAVCPVFFEVVKKSFQSPGIHRLRARTAVADKRFRMGLFATTA